MAARHFRTSSRAQDCPPVSMSPVMMVLALHLIFYAWVIQAIDTCTRWPKCWKGVRNTLMAAMVVMLVADAAIVFRPDSIRYVVAFTSNVVVLLWLFSWRQNRRLISLEAQ